MSTLNLANYSTVWDDNFTKDSGFNWSIWDHKWGNNNDFVFDNRGLTMTTYRSEGWSNAGFIQPNHSASNSQGYGLYQATAYVPANQGIGICILLWPSTDNWPGPELDMVENWSDTTSHTGYFTIHWKGPNNSNGQDIHKFSIDMTKSHTYALDWEPGVLTYYIDGTQIIQVTGSEVPKDFAHGGENEAFGAEVTAASTGYQPTDRVSLTISDMSYSKYVGSPNPPAQSISVSAPGTVREASVGAGVNVTETITATGGLTTVYETVFNGNNVAESGWQAVSLNANGVGTVSAHFQHTGDYLVVVNDPNTLAVKGVSTKITITNGPATAPANVTLTGDNLSRTTPVNAVVGTLSCTDPNPVTYALSYNQRDLFKIVGNKLELAQALPTNVQSAYFISVTATDSTGGSTVKQFRVGVQGVASATAQIHAASVLDTSTASAGFLATSEIVANAAGGGAVTFGAADESFSATGGGWDYHFMPGAGLETIAKFAAFTGDTLTIDASLQGALHVDVSGGNTMLGFGDAQHGIVLQGVTHFDPSAIHWA